MIRSVLVETLVAMQRGNRWPDTEMARRLGVSPSMWSRIRSGERRLGGKALRHVVRDFPRLRKDVLRHLEEQAGLSAEETSLTTGTR